MKMSYSNFQYTIYFLLRRPAAIESNAWTVAEDIKNRIQDEPGPVGPKRGFTVFLQQAEVRLFTLTADSKQEKIPGHYYFKKIQSFLNQHV